MAGVPLMKVPPDEYQRILMIISQQWIRLWLGAVGQKNITWHQGKQKYTGNAKLALL